MEVSGCPPRGSSNSMALSGVSILPILLKTTTGLIISLNLDNRLWFSIIFCRKQEDSVNLELQALQIKLDESPVAWSYGKGSQISFSHRSNKNIHLDVGQPMKFLPHSRCHLQRWVSRLAKWSKATATLFSIIKQLDVHVCLTKSFWQRAALMYRNVNKPQMRSENFLLMFTARILNLPASQPLTVQTKQGSSNWLCADIFAFSYWKRPEKPEDGQHALIHLS